jgi:DNA repair protein RadC
MDHSVTRARRPTRASDHIHRGQRTFKSPPSPSPVDTTLTVRGVRGRCQPATADQILAAARQVIDRKMQRGAEFTSPALVAEYLHTKLAGFDHEVFAILALDTRHRLIQYVEMFHGTIDGASVYSREVVKEALLLNAAAVIFAHNHPSGNPEPSADDRALTLRLKEALELIDVRTLDHVIVGGRTAVSLAERGWL